MLRPKGSFGQVIRERRRQCDLTQDEVARRIRTSTPYIGHLEADKRHPSDHVVTRLADVLGLDRRFLFFLANPHARDLLHPQTSNKASNAWEEFRRDQRLHRTINITPKEMDLLSQVALMGDMRSAHDFLYILNTVRHALLS
ncbi:MAG: helix-turn-helix domain-containing protein [Candidatus Binataceae bacterium]